MGRDHDRALAEFAAAHHSVFTHTHALGAGLTHQEIRHRHETGQWDRLYDDVYAIAGVSLNWRGHLLAACWAGGTRAVASHRSAAALWGFAGARTKFAEITCPRWRRARHEGIWVHESKALDPIELTVVDVVPVTRPELTLLHLAAVCHPSVVEMALDKGEREELLTRASVEAMLQRQGRSGRNGVGALRELLLTRNWTLAPRDSEMETRLIQVLRRNGFPDPVPQYEIRTCGRFVAKADAAYPQWRIAIEYESLEHHAGRSALVRDSARRNRVWAAGWFPITATKADIDTGGFALSAAIRAARDSVLAS